MCLKCTKKLFFGYLNVNSVKNKFEVLELLIKDMFDVFLASEGKTNSSFLEAQFDIPGYAIFHPYQDKYGGGVIFCVNQNIRCRKLETFQFESSVDILTLEINLGKGKLFGKCKPSNINNGFFLNELYNEIAFYNTTMQLLSTALCTKNCILLGDLSIVHDNAQLQFFASLPYLSTSSRNQFAAREILPTGIDHIITNIPKRFM